jgi:hypothetical protein
MRLGDAGLRCRETKLINPNHRLPPWLTEDDARDRSNRHFREKSPDILPVSKFTSKALMAAPISSLFKAYFPKIPQIANSVISDEFSVSILRISGTGGCSHKPSTFWLCHKMSRVAKGSINNGQSGD